jgi:hypothetical protein
MSQGLYSHTTRAAGTVLTAVIYNADHQNHITNLNPTLIGGYSDSVGQMRTVSDPGLAGTEILASSVAGEFERMRYAIKRLAYTDQWYEVPFTLKTRVITQAAYDALGGAVETGTLYLIVG